MKAVHFHHGDLIVSAILRDEFSTDISITKHGYAENGEYSHSVRFFMRSSDIAELIHMLISRWLAHTPPIQPEKPIEKLLGLLAKRIPLFGNLDTAINLLVNATEQTEQESAALEALGKLASAVGLAPGDDIRNAVTLAIPMIKAQRELESFDTDVWDQVKSLADALDMDRTTKMGKVIPKAIEIINLIKKGLASLETAQSAQEPKEDLSLTTQVQALAEIIEMPAETVLLDVIPKAMDTIKELRAQVARLTHTPPRVSGRDSVLGQ